MPRHAVAWRRFAGLAGVLLTLGACGGDDEPAAGPEDQAAAAPAASVAPAFVAPTGCPAVEVLEALHQVAQYRPGGSTAGDLVARGALGLPDGECEYDFENATVELEMLIPVQVQPGPAWTPGQPVDLPYYVWVVDSRQAPPGDIILRRGFPAPFELDEDDTVGLFQEELVLTIPLPDGPQSGRAYQVLIGFQGARGDAGRPF